jgi:hypothetical protein
MSNVLDVLVDARTPTTTKGWFNNCIKPYNIFDIIDIKCKPLLQKSTC